MTFMVSFDRSRQIEFIHAVERFERSVEELKKLLERLDFKVDDLMLNV